MVGGQQGDIDFVSEELNENDILWVQQKNRKIIRMLCAFGWNNCKQMISNFSFKKYSYYLGITFQIKDDLLDVNSNSKILENQSNRINLINRLTL